MAKFKYKLKELKVGDVTYNRGNKSTVTDIDPETGAISWSVESTPDFTSVFKILKQAKDFMDSLSKNKEVRGDSKIQDIQKQITDVFNDLRTHIRANYPEEYARIKMILETNTISSNSGFVSGGTGENHTGPSPRKSTYGAYTQAGYKKVSKDQQLEEATDIEDFLNGINITDPDKRKFIIDRLEGFNTLEKKLNALIPLLQSAKHETLDYYRANPNSFSVVYGTDLANDYLNDLIDLFKKQ